LNFFSGQPTSKPVGQLASLQTFILANSASAAAAVGNLSAGFFVSRPSINR
jgi:hypothetical protein